MNASENLLRFAIVGCGRMGRHHAEQLRTDGRGVVSAVFDPNQSVAERLCRELQFSAANVPTFDELLNRDDIDAAILCTPTGFHFPQATACLDRGWHVLCEKPLANSREEILELIRRGEESAKRKRVFAIGYQRRYWSGFRTLKREISSGRWGRVRAVQTHAVEFWQKSIAGTWRDDPAQNPGGYIGDAGSHKLDMIFHLTGLAPTEVFARTWKCGSGVEIVASVSAVLGDDVPCTVDFLGHAQHLSEDVSIHCERADLLLRHDQLWLARDGRRELLPADEPDSCPVSGLIDAIQGVGPNLCPPDCALPVFDFTRAIFRSAETGQNVQLPLR